MQKHIWKELHIRLDIYEQNVSTNKHVDYMINYKNLFIYYHLFAYERVFLFQ